MEEEVQSEKPPQQTYEANRSIVRDRRIIWYILLVLEVLLLFRFLLKIFGANPYSIFNILITVLTLPFTFLFMGLFTPTTSQTSSNVVEWSTLFAMFAYLVIALVVSRFFRLKKPIDPKEAEEKVKTSVI